MRLSFIDAEARTALIGLALLSACSSDSISSGGISGVKSASGRISLSASIASTRTQTLSGTTFTKNELAQGDLAFDLPMVQGKGGELFNWADASYGGTASWYEEYTQPGSVQIPGTLNFRDCATVDSTTQSFSSAASGGQPGSVELEIFPNGTYQITISAGVTGTPTTVLEVTNTNCNGDGHFVRSTFPPEQDGYVLFAPYFSSYTMGADGYRANVTGTIPSGSTRVNNVLQWVDTTSVEVFSNGTSRTTVPVNVTLTWDITLNK